MVLKAKKASVKKASVKKASVKKAKPLTLAVLEKRLNTLAPYVMGLLGRMAHAEQQLDKHQRTLEVLMDGQPEAMREQTGCKWF